MAFHLSATTPRDTRGSDAPRSAAPQKCALEYLVPAFFLQRAAVLGGAAQTIQAAYEGTQQPERVRGAGAGDGEDCAWQRSPRSPGGRRAWHGAGCHEKQQRTTAPAGGSQDHPPPKCAQP